MVVTANTLSVFEHFSEFQAVSLILFVGYYVTACALFVYIHFGMWFLIRRRILKQTISTHFEPPAGLNPPELSYLFKKKLDQSDFAGLLLHMARRGVIHFRKHYDRKVVLPGPKYEGSLKIYEKHILDVLDEYKSVSTSDLLEGYQTIFARDHHLPTFQKQIEHELSHSRHVKKASLRRRLLRVCKSTLELIVFFVWVPLILAWVHTLLMSGTSDLGSVYQVLIAIFVMTIWTVLPAVLIAVGVQTMQNSSIGRRRVFVLRPEEMWTQFIGFKHYVAHVRSGKLRFDAQRTEKEATLKTLPYATALDQVPHWKDLIT